MFTPENPYKINSGEFLGSIGQFGKKTGDRIENFGKRLAKPLAKNEAKQKRAADAAARNAAKAAEKAAKDKANAAANKRDRAAATRRKNAERNRQLIHVSNLEDLRTQKQVDRVKALAAAKNANKPPAPAAKPVAPKSAARKTASGVRTDNDGVLKPVNPAKKPAVSKGGAAVNTKAGEAYND